MSFARNNMFGPPSGGQNGLGRSIFQRNPNASVPNQNPSFLAGGWHGDDNLHTPCQDVPMPMPGGNQRCGVPSSGDWNGGGYGWKNIARGFLGNCGGGGTWNRQDEMYFDPSHPREMSLGFSREDMEYARVSEKKNAELVRGMSNRQKRLLHSLNSGRIFKLSRLVLEKSPR